MLLGHTVRLPFQKEQLEAVRTGDIEVIILKSFDIRNRFRKILGKIKVFGVLTLVCLNEV